MEDSFYKTLAKKPIGVGILLFNEKGELLVVKPGYKDHWSLPGGIIEEKESPKDGLIREIAEINDYKFMAAEEALPLLSKPSQLRIPKCLEAIKNHKGLLYLENGKEV